MSNCLYSLMRDYATYKRVCLEGTV